MKINREGVTRIVVELKTIVVKIPNFRYQWSHFIQGILSNINESNCWKWNKEKRDLLCPVIWSSWGGWILVMKKADVKRHVKEVYDMAGIGDIDPEGEVKIRYKKWIDANLGGDDKSYNYGYLGDRLVKIDYGQS